MDHKNLIAKLGGPHKLHAKLGNRGIELTTTAVRAWALSERAIPAKYWIDLVAIAQTDGVAVTVSDLAHEAARQRRDKAEQRDAA